MKPAVSFCRCNRTWHGLPGSDRQEHILLVCFECRGGMYHYTVNLANALANKVAVTVLGLDGGAWADDLNGDIGLFVVGRSEERWRRWFMESLNPIYAKKIANHVLEKVRPTAAHIIWDGLLGAKVAGAMAGQGLPLIYTVHDPQPHEENSGILRQFTRWVHHRFLVRRLIRLAEVVHVHSALHGAFLRERWGEDVCRKIVVIQHGAGVTPRIARGGLVPRELRGRDFTGSFVVLFFGRIHPYKGLPYLLAAARILKSKGVPCVVVIAGDGGIEPKTVEGFGDFLVLINRFVLDEEVRAILEVADVVVLPYISATQTGVVPLASAFAKPVIVTNVGALPELVRDGFNGFVVPAGDVEALAEVMSRLATESGLADRLGENSFILYQSELSWETKAEAFLSAYGAAVKASNLRG